MKQPGGLSDLEGAGLRDWEDKLAKVTADAVRSTVNAARAAGETDVVHLVGPEDTSVAGQTAAQVDWSGFPQRGKHCLKNDASVDALLDWRDGNGDVGRNFQEEYLEWRCVRDAGGRITRIEFTTETQEYWETLAAFHPMKTLRVIGRFAGERIADPMKVYGVKDPEALEPDDRKDRFSANMSYPDPARFGASRSPYNNGLRAITFMAQQNNTLGAAIYLAAFAARQLGRQDGVALPVPLTGPLAIANTSQSAVDCRSSDPTIVGAVIGLCWKGRKIALSDPPGIYILGVDPSAFLLPDRSAAVPADWLSSSGVRAPTPQEAWSSHSVWSSRSPRGRASWSATLSTKPRTSRSRPGLRWRGMSGSVCMCLRARWGRYPRRRSYSHRRVIPSIAARPTIAACSLVHGPSISGSTPARALSIRLRRVRGEGPDGR